MKLNDKGFAISTMLYGILIMASLIMVLTLSLMAFRKKSTTDFADQIEVELNSYEYGSSHTTNCPY